MVTMILNVLCIIFVFLGVHSLEDGHQSYFWKDWKPGDRSPGAVAINEKSFVGRIYTWQGLVLASIDFKNEVAKSVETTPQLFWDGIEVLCTDNSNLLYWEDTTITPETNDTIFTNGIRGGFLANTASTLYVGRVNLDSHYHLGMVVTSKGNDTGIWVHVNKEGLKQFTDFELLKYFVPEK